MRVILVGLLWTLTLLSSTAQPINSDCQSAFQINNPADFCSSENVFSTVGASSSLLPSDNCYGEPGHEVFFSFIAVGSAVNILIKGTGSQGLNNPRVILFSGGCEPENYRMVRCGANNGGRVLNLLVESLQVGEVYFMRIAGSGNNQGEFELCLKNFNPPTMPGQDFQDAALLCNKEGFVIQALSGAGDNPDEAVGTCLDVGNQNSERQSSWTTWIADNNGSLTFVITPLNATDDIDFVLYELQNGLNDFNGRLPLRCMASSCFGPTGLNTISTDISEAPGCSPGDDNFLQAVNLEEGKAYGLLINNFSLTGAGIGLTFGGTAEFRGPSADFELRFESDEVTCDQPITIENNSSSAFGNIVNYQWDFGTGANLLSGNEEGPFEIEYETVGLKYVVLTVTSDLGCKVTRIQEINVLPCCSADSELNLNIASRVNIGCGTSDLGAILLDVSEGQAPFLYSVDGESFTSSSSFEDLPEGDYEFYVRDGKGCEEIALTEITSAMPTRVDAGDDLEVENWGDTIRLSASFEPMKDVTISWDPSSDVICEDGSVNCLDPIASPLGTTTYTITILDEDGCISSDKVKVNVQRAEPFYAPTIFSPNDDGINDQFYLMGNDEIVVSIPKISIFDRWGNRVYEARNLSINDLNQGWNGRSNHSNQDLRQGIYAWIASVELFNGTTLQFKGDIFLSR